MMNWIRQNHLPLAFLCAAIAAVVFNRSLYAHYKARAAERETQDAEYSDQHSEGEKP